MRGGKRRIRRLIKRRGMRVADERGIRGDAARGDLEVFKTNPTINLITDSALVHSAYM
jgi:hypothetical protein